ncbi:Homeobox domain-containing protein [Meloidogyne graminicola]|uniref:Homeobox domain-containing protein n=1 Tax=Meloidogyne graminicola TaxID=189291 RepID=A0A8S9ZMW9_9BILA|nr:Homeobox domain-containing protein [Meloidogyne graminicola]
MYNSNNYSIFENQNNNYLKEEEKQNDKFEGMINATAAALLMQQQQQQQQASIFFYIVKHLKTNKNLNNYQTINPTLPFYNNNFQQYFSPSTCSSFINSAFNKTTTLTTPKTELISFCGQQQQTKRERTKYTDSQLNYLENIFRTDKYPDGTKREEIAKVLQLTDVKVQIFNVWFKNRRAKMQNERKFEKLRRDAAKIVAIGRKRIENNTNNNNNINEASTSNYIKREDSIEDTEEEEPKQFRRENKELDNKFEIKKEISNSKPSTSLLTQMKQKTENYLPKFENNNNNIYFNQQWNNSNYVNSYLNNYNEYYSLMQIAANNNSFPQTNNCSNTDFWLGSQSSSLSPSSSSNYNSIQPTTIQSYNYSNTTANQVFNQLASYYNPNNNNYINNYNFSPFYQQQQFLPITQQTVIEQKINRENTTNGHINDKNLTR